MEIGQLIERVAFGESCNEPILTSAELVAPREGDDELLSLSLTETKGNHNYEGNVRDEILQISAP